MTSRNDEQARGLARTAHQTFEPLHLVAYFGPHVEATQKELGIGWLGSYTGMRAAPLGAVPASVVAAAFFGFNPAGIAKAWGLALGKHTPAELDEVRTRCVDAGLRACLGDLVDSPDLARQAERMRAVIERADFGGRPLGAAYASLPWPDAPHLSLWHAATLWREWRGDGHNAALVAHGLRPLEALVLYDAWLPDEPVSATKGRAFLQPSRKWSDEEWEGTADALASEGLLTLEAAETAGGSDGTSDDNEGADAAPVRRHARVTPAGQALRDAVETATDDAAASVWRGVDDAADIVTSYRPFSKAVITAGILPGTSRR